MGRMGRYLAFAVVMIVGVCALFDASVYAYRFSSTNYVIDASTLNTFGGTGSSSSYQLTSSAGEGVIGNGAGGSYKIGAGYAAQLVGTATTSLSLSVQPAGLKGYYSFNAYQSNGGATNDASSREPALDLAGTAERTTGQVGDAVKLDGTAAYFSETTRGTYEISPGSAITAATWVKFDDLSSQTQGILYNDYNCQGWSIQYDTGGLLAQYTNGSGCSGTVTATQLRIPFSDTAAWHHVAATFNRNTSKINLYLDGSLVGTTMGIDTSNVTPGWFPFRIGATWQPANFLNGSVDEVKIYDHELRSDEIAAEYMAGTLGLPSGVSLGEIKPGVSSTTSADIIVDTNTTGYSLVINQDKNLTSGVQTIPAISANIATPAPWSEGTTKGLGFTLTSSNASPIESVWGAGANYAALPTTASTIYSRTGTQTARDVLTMRLRLDVASNQAVTLTPYANTVSITGTITP